jgi:AAA family ATP:ADP antiporter
MPPAEKGCLERTFNLEPQDLIGVPLSAGASMAMLGAYYYLQPLGDTLALSMGLEFTPLVTIGNMTLIVIINPIYAAVVRKLPTEAVVGVMFRAVILALLGFAVLFALLPEVKLLSFCFAVYVGTISLFTTTTLNARLASLHSKAEAKRVYGMIAAGSQTGQLLASSSAPFLFGQLGNLVVIVAAALYECSVQVMACRSKVAAQQQAAAAEAAAQSNAERGAGLVRTAGESGGEGSGASQQPAGWFESMFGGFAILASTPFLRAITGHTLLITFLVSGVWYERAAAVSAAFASDQERYDFFAMLNMIVGVLTLVMQTLCFSHILKWLGFHGTLLAEPVAMAVGLIFSIASPGLLSIAMLDGMRKVFHYSLVKPTKEG